MILLLFFTHATYTTIIYIFSLHDALPIYGGSRRKGISIQNVFILKKPFSRGRPRLKMRGDPVFVGKRRNPHQDRKSTRLNSSHEWISYAVFCLKKKKKKCNCMIRV